jgi:hypothetical protein
LRKVALSLKSLLIGNDNNSFTFEPFHFWAACPETRELGL